MGVEVHYRTGHVVESDDFFAFLYMLPAGLASIRLLFKEKDSVHRFDNLVVRPAFGSEFCGNTKSCGYFQKILESFASFTNGEILADLPEIRPFLRSQTTAFL